VVHCPELLIVSSGYVFFPHMYTNREICNFYSMLRINPRRIEFGSFIARGKKCAKLIRLYHNFIIGNIQVDNPRKCKENELP